MGSIYLRFPKLMYLGTQFIDYDGMSGFNCNF